MKTTLILGATGAQGGSVARFLLRDNNFRVRCLTRDPNAEKAQALREAGAQIVAGDLDNSESLRAALNGCQSVFGVTNFWEHFDKEYQKGMNLLNAVAQAEHIEHFVFSTLPNYHQISGGELSVPHCDLKARLEDEARALELPATFVHVAFYYENFLTFFPPQPQEDGSFTFGFPQGDTPLAAYSVEDTGGVVAAILAQPKDYIGRTVGIVGDDLPPAEYAQTMTDVLGRRFVYNHIPRETFANLGFPGAEELANMFDVQRRFIVSRAADVKESRRLYPQIQTFAAWLQNHKEKFAPLLTAQRKQQ